MFYYRIAELTMQSERPLASFGLFVCNPVQTDITLEKTNEMPPVGKDYRSGSVFHRRLKDGWFFHSGQNDQEGLYISTDYRRLRFLTDNDNVISGNMEWYIRIALECWLIRSGYVSLHAAAVETNNEAYAFTGPSGVGKSTRVASWIQAFDSKLINGDRPLINVRDLKLYGVPWDGKEQCFRSINYPLRTICEVRRSDDVYVRKMSFEQKRKLLLRQCFIPMWDNETAAIQMTNIIKLAKTAEIVRAFCGPTTEDVRALYSALQEHQYSKEERDMKASPGFVLRNVVDEYILMPTGDNIGKFNGTVLLNEVSAFVWEKLQSPISREDLLKAILNEFEVEKTVASKDLDALLETLRGYGVIEDD